MFLPEVSFNRITTISSNKSKNSDIMMDEEGNLICRYP